MTVIEATVPACGCRDCRSPKPSNAGIRDDHRLAHAEFAEYIAAQPVTVPKPSMRTRMLLVGQEWHVPSGACRSCVGQPAHPVHL